MYSVYLLVVAQCFSGVYTQTAKLEWLDGFVTERNNISLQCQSSTTSLFEMRWYFAMDNITLEEIFNYHHPSGIGEGVGNYSGRTDFILDSPSRDIITLIIMDNQIPRDDGSYWCAIQSGNSAVSNVISINVSAEVTQFEFPKPGPDEAKFICMAGPGRPRADIIWSKNKEEMEGNTEQVCPYDNYCITNSTLHGVDTEADDEIKCTATQGYPFHLTYSEVYTIQTGNIVDCCCLEWWIGLLSVCSILAAWILIIFVGVCILHEKVTRLTFWLFILISNIILVTIGLCVVIPMERENSCANNCKCCGCSKLWLCPLITSLLLIVFDVCIGVCICMNRPRRQEEFMQIRDDKTLKLNYNHSTFGISYLSLLKDGTEFAGCDISDKAWASGNPKATCTRTPKGHEWIIEVASAGDAGLYTCIAYIRLCRVSVASKPTEVTVKFNELKQEERDKTTNDSTTIRSRSSPKVAPSPDYFTDEEYAMQPRLPTITPDQTRELPTPQSVANVDIDGLNATKQQGRKKKKKRKKERERYVDEPEPDYEYA